MRRRARWALVETRTVAVSNYFSTHHQPSLVSSSSTLSAARRRSTDSSNSTSSALRKRLYPSMPCSLHSSRSCLTVAERREKRTSQSPSARSSSTRCAASASRSAASSASSLALSDCCPHVPLARPAAAERSSGGGACVRSPSPSPSAPPKNGSVTARSLGSCGSHGGRSASTFSVAATRSSCTCATHARSARNSIPPAALFTNVLEGLAIQKEAGVVSGGRVRVEPAATGPRADREVALDTVLGLNAVLNEVRVTQRLEGDVAAQLEVLDAVHCDRAVECVVDRAVANVRARHASIHMEMQRVTADIESPPHIRELDVGEAADRRGCAMEDALALHAALSSASAPPVARSALAVLSDALRMYGPLDVVVSFNGGKDATVVAHLCRAAFAAHARAAGVAYTPPQAVYWEEEHMFPELDAFVRASAKRYGFNLITYSSGFVEGLQELVSERARPPALVLGTRATDPNGVSATPFEPSSPSWPAFMRINPILNWSYADVWTFLRGNGLAYCSLYDLGYTSLGNSTNSVTNPARHHASSRGPFGIAPGPALAFGVGERGDIGGGGSRETRVAQSGAGQRLECAGGAGYALVAALAQHARVAGVALARGAVGGQRRVRGADAVRAGHRADVRGRCAARARSARARVAIRFEGANAARRAGVAGLQQRALEAREAHAAARHQRRVGRARALVGRCAAYRARGRPERARRAADRDGAVGERAPLAHGAAQPVNLRAGGARADERAAHNGSRHQRVRARACRCRGGSRWAARARGAVGAGHRAVAVAEGVGGARLALGIDAAGAVRAGRAVGARARTSRAGAAAATRRAVARGGAAGAGDEGACGALGALRRAHGIRVRACSPQGEQAVASSASVAEPLAHRAHAAPHFCFAEAPSRRYQPPPRSAPHA
mmetsp:Transcript_1174/g.4593  ORF Transcript_1174/g.4593 Transcript_1174/m.4593 type:complete len:902 (+) Transcript_1174:2323-5028(+)